MTVIARKVTLNVCPACGSATSLTNRPCIGATVTHAQTRRVQVEYVPAEQLRGAVAALEHIAATAGDPIARQTARVALGQSANEPDPVGGR